MPCSGAVAAQELEAAGILQSNRKADEQWLLVRFLFAKTSAALTPLAMCVGPRESPCCAAVPVPFLGTFQAIRVGQGLSPGAVTSYLEGRVGWPWSGADELG